MYNHSCRAATLVGIAVTLYERNWPPRGHRARPGGWRSSAGTDYEGFVTAIVERATVIAAAREDTGARLTTALHAQFDLRRLTEDRAAVGRLPRGRVADGRGLRFPAPTCDVSAMSRWAGVSSSAALEVASALARRRRRATTSSRRRWRSCVSAPKTTSWGCAAASSISSHQSSPGPGACCA